MAGQEKYVLEDFLVKLDSLMAKYKGRIPMGTEWNAAPGPGTRIVQRRYGGISGLYTTYRSKGTTPLPDTGAYQNLVRSLLREQDKTDTFMAFLKESLTALEPVKFPLPPKRKKSGGRPESALLGISDLHAGEKVDWQDTIGQNRYDEDIMEARFLSLADSVIKLTELERAARPIPELVILCMGDLVAGESIFSGQGFHITAPAIDQMTKVGHLLASVVQRISSHYSSVRVECVAGNHGRVAPRGFAHWRSNWDTLAYNVAARELDKQKNVKMIIHQTPIALTEIQGRKVGFSHGSDLAAGSAAKLSTFCERAAEQWPGLLGTPLDICFFGHRHVSCYQAVGNTEVFANGSVVGGNHYSTTRIRQNTAPRQWLVGVHPERISWRYNIGFEGVAE